MILDPIPVTVLTGFLGAGKTTLLNRLLKDPALADTAVIINEFGEVAIDHLLVEQATDGVIQLSDGCICCTVRGDLVDTLADLVDRVQTGKIGKLKRVVIETTGLADPVPVLQSIMAHPVLLQAYRLDGVVTLVDAVNGDASLDKHVEAVRQAAVADRLVMTKEDLATPVQVETLINRLHALNPRAEVVTVTRPDIPAIITSCGVFDPATKTADVNRWLGDTHQCSGEDCDHHDHHHHDHGHHHGVHDSRVSSLSLTYDGALPWSALETFLDLLRSVHGDKLLRLKGIVELAEQPQRPLVIHAVQAVFHPPARLPQWPDERRGARLVVIGYDLAGEHVRRLWAAIANQPAIDQPDRAALEANPLAIAGM